MILAILFFSLFAQGKTENPKIEFYPFGEKVGVTKVVASAPKVDLAMARGEFEIFSFSFPQVPKDELLSNPKVHWTGAQPKAELNAFWLGVHRLKLSSFKNGAAGEVADIPVPLEWIEKKSITVPFENRPSRPNYLFEISTSKQAKPGDYSGELTFQINQKKYKIPLKLKIHSTVLPDRFEIENSYGFAPWNVLKKHYGKWDKKNIELYNMYEHAALEHRMDLHKIYVKFPDETATDPLKDGAVQKQTFLGQTATLYSGAMHSSGFQMASTDLPIPEKYKKVKDGTESSESLQAFWKKMNAAVLKHGLKERSFVYFVDEPEKKDLPAIGENLRAIRKWAPDLRFLVTTSYRSDLEGAVNLWVVPLSLWDIPTEKPESFYQKLSEKKEQFWLYVGCNSHGCSGPQDPGSPDLSIDRASAYQRAFPWMAVRYKAQGLLYYDTVYGYGKGSESSPWKDAFLFTGYGEGNLFYPCTPSLGKCSEPRLISSLRMKILRDGSEDAQILKMAMRVDPTLEAELAKLIPSVRNFKRSTEDFEHLKRKALQALEPPEVKP